MQERKSSADHEVLDALGVAHGGRPQTRRWVWAALLLLALGGVAFGVVRWLELRAIAARPRYERGKVARSDIQVVISATGTLKGRSTVEVGAEVSGRVTEVAVDYNDRVTKGQLLAIIDPEQPKAAVDEAVARVRESDAAIRQARATVTEAEKARDRARVQAGEGLVSQRDLEAAEAAYERAEAALLSAQANSTLVRATLESQRSRLGKTRIVSPIEGIVLSRLVEVGQTVTAGFNTPLLFKLTEDLRRMELLVYIDEADIGRAREGQEATFTVDAYPDKRFPSKVLSLRNEPKEEQNVVTYEAVLQVDNSELLLRPGMTATATIVADVRHGVLSVPNAALRFAPPQLKPDQAPKPGQRRVWILRGDEPEPVPVQTGVSDGRVTELREAKLAEGAEVLTDQIVEAPSGGIMRRRP
jgi:HlyD family secretion protein